MPSCKIPYTERYWIHLSTNIGTESLFNKCVSRGRGRLLSSSTVLTNKCVLSASYHFIRLLMWEQVKYNVVLGRVSATTLFRSSFRVLLPSGQGLICSDFELDSFNSVAQRPLKISELFFEPDE
jgi:hypothetical protein